MKSHYNIIIAGAGGIAEAAGLILAEWSAMAKRYNDFPDYHSTLPCHPTNEIDYLCTQIWVMSKSIIK